MKVYFGTTNEGKLKEAREILRLDVIGTPLEIDEVQSLDPEEVAVKKARAYFEKLKKPVFVEDVSLSIESLNNLPGTYIDAFMKKLGNDGIIRILHGNKNRKALAQTTVVYISKDGNENIFVGRVYGNISSKPKGEGFGWDPIFVPNGENKTFGQMSLDEKNKFSMRSEALNKFKKWIMKNN